MKTHFIKGGKRILGITLAVCILAVSLFTANVGVSINAGAVVTVTDTWDGSVASSFSDTTHSGSSAEDAIVIANAEELAYLISGAGGGTTFGKYYTVAPNSVFDMQGLNGITLDSTLADVKSASPTGKNWSSNWLNTNNTFGGIFDGNGLVVFNVYGKQWASGLFPTITNTRVSGLAAQVKNVTVKNSWFESTAGAYTFGAAAIVGVVKNDGADHPINISGCVVENCNIVGNAKSDDTTKSAALIIADIAWETVSIDNCLTLNNSLTFPSSATLKGGLIADTDKPVNISNTICIGTDPVATGIVDGSATYTNVYTDQESSTNGVTKLTVDQMTGTNAVTNMSALDYSGTWFANTTTQPSLRVFHNFIATNNNDGTHSEVCSDCGLIGVPSNHFYNTIDSVNKISLCACGACIDGIFDIWDSEGATADSYAGGEGTKEKPYIIETVEQLFKMVCEAGEDEDGNPLYYKVADYVNALYINDTRAYASQADFETAAVADSLNNWSEKIPTGFCDSCSHTKPATIMLFNGYFDGNGATIYGLYSKTTSTNSWVNGTGFVPGMVRDSVIKNVVFDTSYVKSNAESAAVVCSSFGLSSHTSHVSAGYCCSDYEEMLIYKATPSLINIAVRNAYVESKNSMGDGFDTNDDGIIDNWDTGAYSFSAGITANYATPKTLTIQNCLFDGTNSTLVSDIGTGVTINDVQVPILTTSGGIFAADANWAYTTVESCLSIGADVSNKANNISALNSYTNVSDATSGVLITTEYTTIDKIPLLNWTAWDIDAVDTYGTPMPKLADGWDAKDFRYYKDAFRNSEYYENPEGATPVDTGYVQGIFSDFDELIGAGTEADPYIIDNAELLFEIIASGGMNRGVPQYFKLACDLDLEGVQWVTYQTDADLNTTYGKIYYDYKAFAGTIDGDGHTITGMYNVSSNSGEYAGFIPELTATGVVKNLHFRNAYAYSATGCGIIAGNAASGSVISGCSIEDSENAEFIGAGTATITNSYITVDDKTTYYLENGSTGTPTVDGVTWYKGGSDNSTPKLVNRADAMPYADADGDGDGYEYGLNDLIALKQKLTRKSAYANIYGDVSRNGTTDIRDLVIMQREVAEDDVVVVLDGFWKNVKAGNISIYYDEDDNYDFARKMELYLEETTGVDILKTKGTTTSNLTIRLVTDSNLGASNYSVAYDLETAVLTISGGSFTAVEQGVLAFINGSDAVKGIVYTGTGSLDDVLNSNGEAYKTALDLDGDKTAEYFYVWGDEFDSGNTVNINGTTYTTASYDKWLLRNKTVDKTDDHETEVAYISAATDAQAPGINVVSGGKLTLKRGINSQTDMYASGISSKNSMLYKYGYAEMLVTLPSDGYAFPSWWLLTHHGSSTNLSVQRSLYSKVYELNNTGDYKYDGSTNSFRADDPTTYQYKLPTQTLEVDIFEIIQKPGTNFNANTGWTRKAVASTDYDVSFNVHKWYTNATVRVDAYEEETVANDSTLTVYDLDWANVETNGGFTNKLLTATGTDDDNYSPESGNTIKVNTTNLKDGSVNGAVTYEGGKSNESTDPGAAGDSMNVNMSDYRSNGQVRQLKYAFLWTDSDMTFYIYEDSTLVYSTTVNKSLMNYQSGESYNAGNYGFDQYAYMLIENHWYTATYRTTDGKWYYVKDNDGISACDMVIDYIRLYQLDGERDIVTPETEAFNSNDRFGN